MESGIRVLLLTASALLLALPCAAVQAADSQDAQPQDSGRAGGDAPQQDAPADDSPPRVVEPEVERRKVVVPGIHSSNIEVGLHYGALSIEDFGVNPSYGASIAYHATEDVFFRGDIGRSTAGLTSAESLANVPVLTGSRHFTYYDLSFGYNFLPGEAFIGRGTALVSSFYILAGLGATEFGGDRKLTVVYGGGYQVLPANWLAVHVEVENHMFESNVLGFSKLTNNIEARLVTSFFF